MSDAIIEWAVAGRPMSGQTESGDLHVVAPFDGGILVALIDGLGHGPDAALAARIAASVLMAHSSVVLYRLAEQCHDALRRTRGVVMTLAVFRSDSPELTWMGVGNVDGALLRADLRASDAPPLRGGVVGFRLPPLREATVALGRGDTVILVTDGIRSGFARERSASSSPVALCESILAQHGKATDDALVVVARYVGVSA